MHVDYDRIAHRYDRHRAGGGPYLGVLARLAREAAAGTVLELGAGTGNNTAAFLEAHPCQLSALDPSRRMLARARMKGVAAHWVQGRAEALPFAPGAFGFVFGCYMLHYVRCLRELAAECARILRTGAVAFVTAPHAFIQSHPMNVYFPSFAAIDLARFPAARVVAQALAEAGFSDGGHTVLRASPEHIDRAYAERVRNRYISTYDLIPADEFEAGLARLDADLARMGRLPAEIVWESEVIWAWKRGMCRR